MSDKKTEVTFYIYVTMLRRYICVGLVITFIVNKHIHTVQVFSLFHIWFNFINYLQIIYEMLLSWVSDVQNSLKLKVKSPWHEWFFCVKKSTFKQKVVVRDKACGHYKMSVVCTKVSGIHWRGCGRQWTWPWSP